MTRPVSLWINGKGLVAAVKSQFSELWLPKLCLAI